MDISPKSFFMAIGLIGLLFVFFFLAGASVFLDSCSTGSFVKPSSGANRILDNYQETRHLLETAWTVSQRDPSSNYLEPCFRKLFMADMKSGFLDFGFMENRDKAEVLEKACKDSSFNSRLKTFIDSPIKTNAGAVEALLKHYGLTFFY